MKKILLAVLLIFSLSACKQTDDRLDFNGKKYEYKETDEQGFDVYVNNDHVIEIQITEDGFILSTIIDEDIYIAAGTTETYVIKKNGSTVLFSGASQTTTGTEEVDWNDDILPIIEKLSKQKDD